MSLSYRVVARKILAGEDQGKTKYYGMLKRTKLITYQQLCRRIMVQSSATRGDVSLILDNLMDSLTEYLESGHSVQLSNLGTFRMTAGSRGADTEEEFNASYMKTPRVLFQPSSELRAQAARSKFEKIVPEIRYIGQTLPPDLGDD